MRRFLVNAAWAFGLFVGAVAFMAAQIVLAFGGWG